MTAVGNIAWGPASFGSEFDSSITFASWYYALDDSNDALAGIFVLPKTGNITKVGFNIISIVGDPPAYKVGLTTISAGTPQQTAYGGGSIDDYDPSTTGWKWITLSTPSSGSAGDIVCVHVFPGASAPSGTAYMALSTVDLFLYVVPWHRQFSTSWNYGDSAIPMALQYEDGTIVGFPAIGTAVESISNATTPDEVGDVFTLPIDLKVIGAILWSSGLGGAGTYELNLYDADDNVLGTCVIDTATNIGAGWYEAHMYFESEISLVADAVYRLALKGTNATTGYVDGWQFNSATDRQTATYPESARWYKTERTDEGAWTDSEDSIMHMGLIVSDITSGTSGSGAGPGATGYYGFVG